MHDTLRIGTRGSELALAQSQLAIDALHKLQPDLDCQLQIIHSAGDARTDIPLNEVNKATGTQDKGVFIAALEDELAAGHVDCAVHSLKDMPGELDERFEIAAILPREEIWDVLVLKAGADVMAPRIATGSVRRAKLAECYWSGRAVCTGIRGNVATRLHKLVNDPQLDGTLLARAGLKRLGYTGDSIEVEGETLHLVDMGKDSFMPALGQGAIAVEIRKGDEKARSLISGINDAASALCVRCERAFLSLLQADCSVPVGGYASLLGSHAMLFRAIYFTPEGRSIRLTQHGFADKPEEVAAGAYEQLLRHLGKA